MQRVCQGGRTSQLLALDARPLVSRASRALTLLNGHDVVRGGAGAGGVDVQDLDVLGVGGVQQVHLTSLVAGQQEAGALQGWKRGARRGT